MPVEQLPTPNLVYHMHIEFLDGVMRTHRFGGFIPRDDAWVIEDGQLKLYYLQHPSQGKEVTSFPLCNIREYHSSI